MQMMNIRHVLGLHVLNVYNLHDIVVDLISPTHARVTGSTPVDINLDDENTCSDVWN